MSSGPGNRVDSLLRVNEVSLHYLEWSGPVGGEVLILPGNGWTRSWGYLAETWRPPSRVIVLGIRGLGESGPAETYTWQAVLADVAAAFDKLAVQGPITLVGGQGAAGWALLYAAEHPDLIAQLVTLDLEIPKPGGGSGRPLRGMTWPSLEDAAEQFIARWGVSPHLADLTREALREFLVQDPTGAWRMGGDPAIRAAADSCRFYACEPELREFLGRIHCPVLALFGEQSGVGRYAAEVLGQEIANCRVRQIDGAGHLLQLVSPDAVLREIQDWLRSVEHRRPSVE